MWHNTLRTLAEELEDFADIDLGDSTDESTDDNSEFGTRLSPIPEEQPAQNDVDFEDDQEWARRKSTDGVPPPSPDIVIKHVKMEKEILHPAPIIPVEAQQATICHVDDEPTGEKEEAQPAGQQEQERSTTSWPGNPEITALPRNFPPSPITAPAQPPSNNLRSPTRTPFRMHPGVDTIDPRVLEIRLRRLDEFDLAERGQIARPGHRCGFCRFVPCARQELCYPAWILMLLAGIVLGIVAAMKKLVSRSS